MYRCDRCGDSVKGACHKVTSSVRPVTYVGNEVSKKGAEIAKEEKVCPKCFANIEQTTIVKSKITMIQIQKVKVRPEPEFEFEGKESRRKYVA